MYIYYFDGSTIQNFLFTFVLSFFRSRSNHVTIIRNHRMIIVITRNTYRLLTDLSPCCWYWYFGEREECCKRYCRRRREVMQKFCFGHTQNCILGHITSNFYFGEERYRKGRGRYYKTVSWREQAGIVNLKSEGGYCIRYEILGDDMYVCMYDC